MTKTTGEQLKKWRRAAREAIKTDKWTEIMFRALTKQVAARWKLQSFRGKRKRESAGAVDVLAIRRNTRDPQYPPLQRGDLFEFILVQLKGGSASPPDPQEKSRLWAIKEHYAATEVVLFQWQRRKKTGWSVLRPTPDGQFTWIPSSRRKIFG